VHFDERDVVRHKIVQQIVKAYEAFSNPASRERRSADRPRTDLAVGDENARGNGNGARQAPDDDAAPSADVSRL